MAIINHIEDHPITSLCIWICSVVCSYLLSINYNSHIPPLIMDAAQMIVWAVGVLAGMLTINGWYKTHYKKKKK